MTGRGSWQDVWEKKEVKEKKGENQGWRDRGIYKRGEDGKKTGTKKERNNGDKKESGRR